MLISALQIDLSTFINVLWPSIKDEFHEINPNGPYISSYASNYSRLAPHNIIQITIV